MRFKAACHRYSCGWVTFGTNQFKVIGDFLQHLEEAHAGEYSLSAIGILELGCEAAEPKATSNGDAAGAE
jgi:hypothetical protein